MNDAMDIYPYGRGNPFQSPERYEYSACSSPGFLKAWRTKRQAFVQMLELIHQRTIGSHTVLHDNSLNKILDKNEPAQIEALILKFEVHRRLHSHYTSSMRKAPGSTPACLDHYSLFAESLARRINDDQDLKALSCLLKLHDCLSTIASNQWTYPSAQRVLDSLNAELTAVEKLARASQ